MESDAVMNEREIKTTIEIKAELIASILAKGNDVEIRTSGNGIKVVEVKRRVIAR